MLTAVLLLGFAAEPSPLMIIIVLASSAAAVAVALLVTQLVGAARPVDAKL